LIDGKSYDRMQRGKSAYSREERDTYIQSFLDQRAAVTLLATCLTGECNLFVEATHLLSLWVLKTYNDIIPPMLAALPSLTMQAGEVLRVLRARFGEQATTTTPPRRFHQRFVRSVAEAVTKLEKAAAEKAGGDNESKVAAGTTSSAGPVNCVRLLVNVWLECQLRPSHVHGCTVKRILSVGVSKIRKELSDELVQWAREVQCGCGDSGGSANGRNGERVKGNEKAEDEVGAGVMAKSSEKSSEKLSEATEGKGNDDLASQLLTVLDELVEVLVLPVNAAAAAQSAADAAGFVARNAF
jgi:hypothetical protein